VELRQLIAAASSMEVIAREFPDLYQWFEAPMVVHCQTEKLVHDDKEDSFTVDKFITK
jgi:hypothetical protein